jgi:hypothetical protein
MTIRVFVFKDEAQGQCFQQYKGGNFQIIYMQGDCQITANNKFTAEGYEILFNVSYSSKIQLQFYCRTLVARRSIVGNRISMGEHSRR